MVYTGVDESWEKPEHEKPFCPEPVAPTRDPKTVLSLLSGVYEPVTTFNIGGWGQSTKWKELKAENGAPVGMLTNFNYLGWELASHINVSECDYLHVEYYTTDGTTLALTPISPDKEGVIDMKEVKQNEWNVYDLPLTDWAMVDFKDVFQIKYDKGGNATGYLANVYFYNSEGKEVNPNAKPINPDPEPVVETPEELYIVGNIKDNEWAPAKADKMNKEGDVFTIEVNLSGTDSKSYFSFIPVQGEWDVVNAGTRYGAVNQDLFDLNQAQTLVVYNQETETLAKDAPAFCVNYAGSAVVTVDFAKMTVTVTESTGISEIENADNAAAVYFNLQGVRVANPANGIFLKKVGNTVTKVMVK